MKKYLILISLFSVLCFLCAFTWPPEDYEMPRTLLDAATVEDTFSGLRVSFGSIANVGLILLGIILSVSLISTIFRRLFLGKLDRFHPPRPRPRWEGSREAISEIRERDLSSVYHRRQDRHQKNERGGDRL